MRPTEVYSGAPRINFDPTLAFRFFTGPEEIDGVTGLINAKLRAIPFIGNDIRCFELL
ncbi:MAG: hypothetical protein VB959_17545 [Rhodospirillales bacterium]